MFRIAYSTIPASWEVAVLVSKEDAKLPFAKGTRVFASDFPRENQNISGIPAVKAILTVFSILSEGTHRVAKLDSDTLLFRPEEFDREGDDVVGFVHLADQNAVMGTIYSLSAAAISSANRFAFCRHQETLARVPEDRTISRWATAQNGVKLRRLPHTHLYWEWYGKATNSLTRPRPYQYAGNYGWREAAYPDRTTAAKVMECEVESRKWLKRRETLPPLT